MDDMEALQHMLVHYSRKRHDTLKPLTYEELLADRTTGRWADQPDMAAKYVEGRRRFEKDLHKRLAARGITTKPDTSFLYATLSGHERFGEGAFGSYKHEAELTPEVINSSFFDVVGTGKSRTAFGQKGLLAALKKWKDAEKANALKEEEYMGMTIKPRIEIMTNRSIIPNRSDDDSDNGVLSEKVAEKHPALTDLLMAKALSDQKRYIQKNMLLRRLVLNNPDDFAVSEAPNNGIIGLSHIPTKFMIHTPVRNMPTNFLQAYEARQQQEAMKIAANVRLTYVMGY